MISLKAQLSLCTSTLALLAFSLPPLQAQGSSQLKEGVAQAKKKIYPALVNISVVRKGFGGGRTVRQMLNGSGTIISKDGHVLTNFHVAHDGVRIVCTLTSGEQIPADVVGLDPLTDLAVIKLRLAEREDPEAPLAFATFGDSDKVDVGDPVIAVGNPASLSSSMTLGIVSNPHRVFTGAGGQVFEFDFGSGNRTGLFTVWIQTDALIIPGNSGGPLVNFAGEIIGVNTRAGSSFGFASPSKLVRQVVDQLLAHGEVRRGFVGTSFQPIAKLGLEQGALISSVMPSAPAAEAGIEAGDILLAIDGEPVTTRFAEQIPPLYNRIANLKAGSTSKFTVLRKGERLEKSLTVARMKDYVGETIEQGELGITVQEITEPMARLRQYPDAEGVVVTGVRPGKPFEEAKPAVQTGDVLVGLAGKKVEDLAAFRKILDAFEGKELVVEFRRGRQDLVTLVDLVEVEKPKSGGELAKPWLGLRAQVMTEEVQKAMKLVGTKGFRVTEVFPWTKAAAAGFQTGDVLLSIDGEAFDSSRPQDAKDLKNAVEEYGVGETVPFEVLRDGKKLKLEVELEESPSSALDAETAKSKFFEFKVREMTFMDRISRHLEKETRGLIVTEVSSGGWASIAGLPRNSLILSIEDKVVPDVKAFEAVMKDIEKARPRVVSVFIKRGVSTAYVFLEPDWSQTKGKSK